VVPRWVLSVVAAAVAVAALDIAVLVVVHKRSRPAVRTGADLVAVIDPNTSRVVERVPVGHTPTVVAAGYGGAWVLNKGEGTLTHIDARTHDVVDTRALDVIATDLAVGAGGVWFAGHPKSDLEHPHGVVKLERIDPATGDVDRDFKTRTGASAIAAGGGALWSSGVLPGHVRAAARSDPDTGAMRRVNIQIDGDLLTANERAAYWVGSLASRVARVSTHTGRLTRSLALASNASLAAGHVPPNPTDVALGGDALWISAVDGSLIRVDPSLRGVVASIPVCGNAIAVAYGEGAVWVACGNATVVRVDPRTDRAGSPIRVGGLPRGIAAGDGSVWVTLN
jgi:hypothetical protein